MANRATRTQYVCVHDVRRYATAHVTAKHTIGNVIRSRAGRSKPRLMLQNDQVRSRITDWGWGGGGGGGGGGGI